MAQKPVAECHCPRDIPKWDGVDIDLGGQLVHRLPCPTPFSMPVSYDLYRQRQSHDLESLELRERWAGLTLLRTGLWRGELLRLLDPATQSMSRRVQRLPSPFWVRGRIHNGGINTLRHSVAALQSEVFQAGHSPKALFLAYLTCPICMSERGGERILVLRHWIPNLKLTAKLQKQSP